MRMRQQNNKFRESITIILLSLITLALFSSGCGGSGGSLPEGPSAIQGGSLLINVNWPEENGIENSIEKPGVRVIPIGTQKIMAQIYNSDLQTVSASAEIPYGQSSVTINNIPIGPKVALVKAVNSDGSIIFSQRRVSFTIQTGETENAGNIPLGIAITGTTENPVFEPTSIVVPEGGVLYLQNWLRSNVNVQGLQTDMGLQGAYQDPDGLWIFSDQQRSVSQAANITISGKPGNCAVYIPGSLFSIQVTPVSASKPAGLTQQFTATGIRANNTTYDITNQVTWSSSDTNIATISGTGLASTLTAGTATITATDPGTGISGSATLTVTSAQLDSIQVTPTNPDVPNGLERQMTATGIYTDSSNHNITEFVTWSSSDTNVATISDVPGSKGLASTHSQGSSVITATEPSSEIFSSTTLTVTPGQLSSIEVTPVNPLIPLGLMKQFTATGVYSDNTTQNITAQVTWSSSDNDIATISNAGGSKGLATSVNVGTVTITALDVASGISHSTYLNVNDAQLASIEVTPANPSVADGSTLQFTATGLYTDNSAHNITDMMTWESSGTNIATISNAAVTKGLATARSPGSTFITAKDPTTNMSALTTMTVTDAELVSITVTPANTTVVQGMDKQFTATGLYTDSTTKNLTTAVTWSSSNIDIATISNEEGSKGKAHGVSQGQVTITAADHNTGIYGSTTLTVTPIQLVSIAVTPANPEIPLGNIQQFTATGTYSNSSTQDLTLAVTWSSSDAIVASISNAGSKGLATSINAGSTTITATDPGSGINGSTILTVKEVQLVSIEITPANPTIVLGMTQQFTATGTYDDSSTADITSQVTWTSSDHLVATISNLEGSRGMATSVNEGTATITAIDPVTGINATTTLTVDPDDVVSIAVTPANPTISLGSTKQFTATATYADSLTRDVTEFVTWTSSNPVVATISNASGSRGLATSVNKGSAIITATDPVSGVSGNTTLTVN